MLWRIVGYLHSNLDMVETHIWAAIHWSSVGVSAMIVLDLKAGACIWMTTNIFGRFLHVVGFRVWSIVEVVDYPGSTVLPGHQSSVEFAPE